MQASDTVGMFQLESPGQQDLVGRLQPVIRRTSSPTSACSAPAPCRGRGARPLHHRPPRRRPHLSTPGPGTGPARHLRSDDLALYRSSK
ncbi:MULTISPECIES: hypothetical protein [unclassified Streptomyces]|uniref:hypothetical protein n=1 Tax=unclassified Streptomyces TaxID=2593676 RepID=UPI0024A82E7C|nr:MULTISPECIES: hypothetical protein [unclassified Streptomyces]